MGTYALGQPVYLRGLFWGALVAFAPSETTGVFATPLPHGLTSGQPVAFLNGQAGGLPLTDAYGQYQVYFLVNVNASDFQVAYTPGGAPLGLGSAVRGVAAILADPTVASVKVTTPDGVTAPFTPSKEQLNGTPIVGVYGYSYASAQKAAHTYEYDGAGALVAVGKGTFTVQ